jgi:hypothetical protein
MSIASTIIVNGLSFRVDYGIQPEEVATHTYPGCPRSITINTSIPLCIIALMVIGNDWVGLIQEQLMDKFL